MNLSELSKAFAAAFVTAKRDDGSEYVRLSEDAPHRDAFTDIVHAAHGEMLPDDTRYTMIAEIADRLADMDPDDWEDRNSETCDALVDVYNAARLRWLASHLHRAFYCDEAQKEGLADVDADMFTRVGLGQYMEYREIYGAVVDGLRELAEQLETEADEG